MKLVFFGAEDESAHRVQRRCHLLPAFPLPIPPSFASSLEDAARMCAFVCEIMCPIVQHCATRRNH